MGSRIQIDRKKHEVDVAEHVLSGGVRADAVGGPDGPIVALDIGMRGWPFGIVASAVQVQVLPVDDDFNASSDRPPPADGRTPPAPPDRARRRWR
jgi:hypothetical protein